MTRERLSKRQVAAGNVLGTIEGTSAIRTARSAGLRASRPNGRVLFRADAFSESITLDRE